MDDTQQHQEQRISLFYKLMLAEMSDIPTQPEPSQQPKPLQDKTLDELYNM